MLVYATNEDLTAWPVSPLPANAASLLRSASLLIRSTTMTAVYAVDATGLPTDPKVLEAFKDATCRQVEFWVAADVDPTNGGAQTKAPVQSKKLGSGMFQYDTSVNASVAAFQARRDAATSLCAEAWLILQQAGIVPGGVQRG